MEYNTVGAKPKNEPKFKPIPDGEIKAVVHGKTIKKNGIEKVAGSFISSDVKKVKSYLLTDVIIPNAKKLISDVVSRGVDMLLFNGGGRPNSGYGSYGSVSGAFSYKDYNRSYTTNSYGSARPPLSEYNQGLSLSNNTLDNLVVKSYADGREVLSRMNTLIETYGMISVYETCKLLGVVGRHTDFDWGWSDIRAAEVVPYRGEFLLKMPRPISLR